MKIVRVVAAVIKSINEKGQTIIFATQRGYGDMKDGWEFPGGKIEPRETPQEALKREIMEEIEMREILFRGKRIDNGEWIYGGIDSDWAMPYEKRKRYWIIPPFHDGVMVDPETVGQYTGINDKDGKKIVESRNIY